MLPDLIDAAWRGSLPPKPHGRFGTRKPMPLQLRLERMSIPEPNTGCTLWLGSTSNGYGLISIARPGDQRVSNKGPHVIAYELVHGPVPRGFVVDHKCRNTLCINPQHLEAVTQRVNARRSLSPFGKNARKTECLRGHPLSGDNLYVTPSGRRQCQTCRHMHSANHAKKRRPPCHT